MKIESVFPNLSFSRINALFHVRSDITLPAFTGSTFHGVLGRALSDVHYSDRREACSECSCRPECRYANLYSYMFETPADHPFVSQAGALIRKNQKEYLKPVILDPPRGGAYPEGDQLMLQMTLVGKAIECLPFAVCALRQFSQARFGPSNECLMLDSIIDGLDSESLVETLIYNGKTDTYIGPGSVCDLNRIVEDTYSNLDTVSTTSNIHIRFLTPFRFMENNHLGATLDFKIFMSRILDRIELLSVHSPLTEPIDKNAILDAAAQVKTEKSSLQWYDWERYSSRQNSRMKFGGYLGDIVFSGNLIPFLPYIKMGEYLHVGKQTSFGLGKYRVMVSQT